jgi:hypothetical protein
MMKAQEQVLEVELSVQDVCAFIVYKSSREVIRQEIDGPVFQFIKDYVVGGFLKTTNKVKALDLKPDAHSTQLAKGSEEDFCSKGYELALAYTETIRSRTALVVTARFKLEGRSFVGFFQLRETAVVALYPHQKELKVVEQAFKKFEKAFVIPSLAKQQQASIYQRSPSSYFEEFVGVDKPPTPEERLSQIVKDYDIQTLSELLEVLKNTPEAGQARVRVELLDAKATTRLDAVKRVLAMASTSFVLVQEGPEAYLRIGRRRITVEPEQLKDVQELLKERNLL